MPIVSLQLQTILNPAPAPPGPPGRTHARTLPQNIFIRENAPQHVYTVAVLAGNPLCGATPYTLRIKRGTRIQTWTGTITSDSAIIHGFNRRGQVWAFTYEPLFP